MSSLYAVNLISFYNFPHVIFNLFYNDVSYKF